MKTEELTGETLNFAVAMAVGLNPIMSHDYYHQAVEEYGSNHWFAQYLETEPNIPVVVNVLDELRHVPGFSDDWAIGGPIIEKEKISFVEVSSRNEWVASVPQPNMIGWRILGYGPTQLIAAMRCFVKLKLGDEVDLPVELT